MKRTAQIIAGAFALAGGCCAGVPMAGAHHAMVMYDGEKWITLNGAVVEFRWTNPHVFLKVDGSPGEGQPSEVWLLETSSPVNLARLGTWSETLLKPGDRVRVEINPHRETARKEARLMRLTLVETGQTIGTAYRGPSTPPPSQ
jgi:hypothetical protein